jgi:hypothetical protein
MAHMTREEIENLPDPAMRNAALKQLGWLPKSTAPRRNKYGAKPVHIDGHRFDSQAEAKYYLRLLLMVKVEQVTYFLRQVPFHLPGGIRYLVDFQVFYTDGRIEYIDVKGHRTAMFVVKKKMVEAHYPVKIKEVK